MLRWSTYCAERVVIDPEVGQVDPSGEIHLHPTTTTTYHLRIESPWADWIGPEKTARIEVLPVLPEAELQLSPSRVWEHDPVTLTWHTRNASRVILDPGSKVVEAEGTLLWPALKDTTTFRLTAEGDGVPPAHAEARVVVRGVPSIPALAEAIDYSDLFSQQAPRIYFAKNEPNPFFQFGKHARVYLFPYTEQEKLNQFVSFLRQYPQIYFEIVGTGYEWGSVTGNRRSAGAHSALLSRRHEVVYNYLVNSGISPSRVLRQSILSISEGTLKGNNQAQQEARATIFKFAGVKPTLVAHLEPESIRAGETVFLVWNTQNADVVWVGPGPRRSGIQGQVRVQPQDTSSYTLTASNSYGLESRLTLTAEVQPEPPPPPPPPPDPAAIIRENLDDVLFDRGSSALTPFAKQMLDRAASFLLQPANRGIPVRLLGFIDDSEPVTLARQRADRCRRYLTQAGVPEMRLRTDGSRKLNLDDFDPRENPQAWRVMQRRVRITYDSGE
jgi:outer membrane protein OmpA-like peptidoglycan-associated protein